MTDFIPLDLPSDAETLIAEAQAARVRAHVRAMLSRIESPGDQALDRKGEAEDQNGEADE